MRNGVDVHKPGTDITFSASKSVSLAPLILKLRCWNASKTKACWRLVLIMRPAVPLFQIQKLSSSLNETLVHLKIAAYWSKKQDHLSISFKGTI